MTEIINGIEYNRCSIICPLCKGHGHTLERTLLKSIRIRHDPGTYEPFTVKQPCHNCDGHGALWYLRAANPFKESANV